MIDAHRHPPAGSDGTRAADEAQVAGLLRWVWVGTRPEDWAQARRLARATGSWLALGLHPWWVGQANLGDLRAMEAFTDLDAIGECGLDRRRGPELSTQRSWFDAQLDLARARQLPAVLHVVGAWPEVQAHLRRAPLPAGGVWHGFQGHPQLAEQALGEGLFLSFGPGFDRSPRARASAALVPGDRLLVESDDHPDGPRALVQVLAALAEVREQDPTALAALTAANAGRCFGQRPHSLRLRSS
jgi:TatD DNase family protein